MVFLIVFAHLFAIILRRHSVEKRNLFVPSHYIIDCDFLAATTKRTIVKKCSLRGIMDPVFQRGDSGGYADLEQGRKQ